MSMMEERPARTRRSFTDRFKRDAVAMVLVEGNHHQHWIDGHQTADLIDLDEQGRALEGVLAVQVHVGPAMKIQYKDFRIKHLSDELPLRQAKDVAIPAEAYQVRPQGRLPKDWKPAIYGEREKK